MCVCVCVSVCVCLSVCVCPSVCPSVCLSVCLCVCVKILLLLNGFKANVSKLVEHSGRPSPPPGGPASDPPLDPSLSLLRHLAVRCGLIDAFTSRTQQTAARKLIHLHSTETCLRGSSQQFLSSISSFEKPCSWPRGEVFSQTQSGQEQCHC